MKKKYTSTSMASTLPPMTQIQVSLDLVLELPVEEYIEVLELPVEEVEGKE